MAVTTKVPLGAATLVRKYYIDVNTNTFGSPTWVGVFGVTSFKPSYESTLQDTSDFDGGGYKGQTKTAEQWSVELTVERKETAASRTAYDVGQEWLRSHSVGLMGASARVDIRYYEVTSGGPAIEAYRGYATVGWTPKGGEMDATDEVDITLSGDGQLTPITHPSV